MENVYYSARGFAVELDGEVEGYAGVMYSMPLQAFSHASEKLKKRSPKSILKTGRKLVGLMEEIGRPVYALAGEKTAPAFLTRLGFEQIEEGVFLWTP